MEKGIYSAYIGILVILLAISTMTISANYVQLDKTKTYKNLIIETKKDTQNLAIVLDKVIDDAIADSIYDFRCTPGHPGTEDQMIISRMQSYFNNSIIKNAFPNCTIAQNTQSASQNVTVAFTIKCQKSVLSEFSVEQVFTRTYQRNYDFPGPQPPNTVQIRIFDGSTVEFNKTVSPCP